MTTPDLEKSIANSRSPSRFDMSMTDGLSPTNKTRRRSAHFLLHLPAMSSAAIGDGRRACQMQGKGTHHHIRISFSGQSSSPSDRAVREHADSLWHVPDYEESLGKFIGRGR